MKSLTKILLAATLLTGANYTFAHTTNSTAKVSASTEIQDRHLSGFNAIEVSGSFDVFIVQGATESVKVEAPSDVMDHIITEVEDGVLKIHDKHGSGWSWGNWWNNSHKKVAIYVSAKDINDIGISGSGDVEFKDGIRTSSLKLRLSGSGDVNGKVEVKNLESSLSGSGDVKLSGHAESSSIGMSGSGDFSARGLVTENTVVHISGSGDASVCANNSLEAAVSGSGDISYTGRVQHVISSKSGSGDISRN